MAVSLVSINVNGIAEHHKRVKVFESLRSLNFDLFFLQETHLADPLSGQTWRKIGEANVRGLRAQIDRRASLCLFIRTVQ